MIRTLLVMSTVLAALPARASADSVTFVAMEHALGSAKDSFMAPGVGKNASYFGRLLDRTRSFVHQAPGVAGRSTRKARSEIKKGARALVSIRRRLLSLEGRKTI